MPVVGTGFWKVPKDVTADIIVAAIQAGWVEAWVGAWVRGSPLKFVHVYDAMCCSIDRMVVFVFMHTGLPGLASPGVSDDLIHISSIRRELESPQTCRRSIE